MSLSGLQIALIHRILFPVHKSPVEKWGKCQQRYVPFAEESQLLSHAPHPLVTW